MSSLTFVVEEHPFELTAIEYAKSDLLLEMSVLATSRQIVLNNVTLAEFQIVYDFLKNGKVPSMAEFSLVEYFRLSFRSGRL